MPTKPTSIDATKYREIDFIGGRILQGREMNLLQSMQRDSTQDGTFDLQALYSPGATLNVQFAISGTVLTLQPIDNTRPMLVFVRGRFEAFTAAPLSYTAGQNSTLYVNYVLWRVTMDGVNGTLCDPALVDPSSNESTAELGQLKITVGQDDSGPLNSVTMLECNTSPIPMTQIVWTSDGAMKLQNRAGAQSQALAGADRGGLVSTSTDNPIVASTDDPRMSDARTPAHASVFTDTVTLPEVTSAQASVVFNAVSETAPEVKVTDDNGGVNLNRTFFSSWRMSGHSALTIVAKKLSDLYGSLASMQTTVTAFIASTTLSLNKHIAQSLGSAATHPLTITLTSDTVGDGLDVIGSGDPSKLAFAASQSGHLGGIHQDGDYELLNPSFSSTLSFAQSGTNYNLSRFSALAAVVAGLVKNGTGSGTGTGTGGTLSGDVSGAEGSNVIQKISGKSIAGLPSSATLLSTTQMVVFNGSANRYETAAIPTSGSGSVTLAGDVTGASSASTVVKIQGQAVKAATPNVGDILTYAAGMWGPAIASGGISNATGTDQYIIIKIGNYRIAFGVIAGKDGTAIPLPASDWNKLGVWGYVQTSPCLAVVNKLPYISDVLVAARVASSGQSKSISITASCSYVSGTTDKPADAVSKTVDGTWANVTVFTISLDV